MIDKRLTAIKTAMPLTKDEGVIIPFERLVKVFALQLQQIIVAIRDYDLDIAKQFSKHSDHDIFDPLPGAGPVFAPSPTRRLWIK